MMQNSVYAQSLSRLDHDTEIMVYFTIGLMKAVCALSEELDRLNDVNWRAALRKKLELSVKQDADFLPMMPRDEVLCYEAVLAGIREALTISAQAAAQ